MNTINQVLCDINVGNPLSYENLTLFPLLLEGLNESHYVTLDEAMRDKTVEVTEIDEDGDVPELLLRNDSDKPILILDGEELIGAKQNRIVNLTILAPPKKTIKLPVSCVERGRWAKNSDEFITSKRLHFAKGRSKKLKDVNLSMKTNQSYHSNQSEVWNDISDKAEALFCRSDTDAMSDIFEEHESSLDKYTHAFAATPLQVGAIFAINNQLCGLEIFDTAQTCHKLLPKLVQSYALDAIEEVAKQTSSPLNVDPLAGFMNEYNKASTEQSPAIGLGNDVRINGGKLSGGGLIHNDALVHLCLFNDAENGDDTKEQSHTNIYSASIRSRNRKLH